MKFLLLATAILLQACAHHSTLSQRSPSSRGPYHYDISCSDESNNFKIKYVHSTYLTQESIVEANQGTSYGFFSDVELNPLLKDEWIHISPTAKSPTSDELRWYTGDNNVPLSAYSWEMKFNPAKDSIISDLKWHDLNFKNLECTWAGEMKMMALRKVYERPEASKKIIEWFKKYPTKDHLYALYEESDIYSAYTGNEDPFYYFTTDQYADIFDFFEKNIQTGISEKIYSPERLLNLIMHSVVPDEKAFPLLKKLCDKYKKPIPGITRALSVSQEYFPKNRDFTQFKKQQICKIR